VPILYNCNHYNGLYQDSFSIPQTIAQSASAGIATRFFSLRYATTHMLNLCAWMELLASSGSVTYSLEFFEDGEGQK